MAAQGSPRCLGRNPSRSREGIKQHPLRLPSPCFLSKVQVRGSLRAGHRFQTASFSSAEQRTFRCCSGGGDSAQRPLPLTASSPAPLLQFPLALPCSPTSGTALGVWPGGRYKVPGAGPGQLLSPLPPAACWAGRGCSSAPRWPGSLRSSVLANFPGCVPACRSRSVSPRPPGLVL